MKTINELADKISCCMIEGLGLVAGKFNYEEQTLKSPRIMKIIPPQGQELTKVAFPEIPGSPEVMFLIKKPVFAYEIKKKEIREHYQRTISNIVVTDKMPNLEIVK
jgi:hypothetical protein